MSLHNIRVIPKLCRLQPPFTRGLKRQSVQVTVLGADTPVGFPTCFLLKQNPLISVLHVQGSGRTHGLAADLTPFDTRCKVVSHQGFDTVPEAVKGADIVVMLGLNCAEDSWSLTDVLQAESKRMIKLVKHCVEYAPRALLLVNVPPVSVTVPAIAALMKRTDWYHPGRLVGVSAFQQLRINSLLGNYLSLDPRSVHVPLLGGPETDLCVPVLSRASPQSLKGETARRFVALCRDIRQDEFPKESRKKPSYRSLALAEAAGVNRMITTVCLGFWGDPGAVCSGFVRCGMVDACRHLVSEVRFSRQGVVHNYGVPLLSKLELQLLERAALDIREREKLAEELINHEEQGKSGPPPYIVREKEKMKIMQTGVAK